MKVAVLLLLLISSSLEVTADASITTKLPPRIDISIIKYEDFSGPDSSQSARDRAREALTTMGIVQIKNVPNFAAARKAALGNLAECFTAEAAIVEGNTMVMADGSTRRSTGAASSRGVGGLFAGACGGAAMDLRVAVDLGVKELFRSLDGIAMQSSAGVPPAAMFPYETYDDVLRNGEHLEHLHAYYHPGNKSPSDGDSAPVRITSGVDVPKTVDFHTDGGLFIAMTTGLYQNTQPSSHSGLYIRKPDGSVGLAELDDDALVVMVGETGARWLGMRLSAPLKAVEHAMHADLSRADATSGKQASRAWYGKMYLPPADAVINNNDNEALRALNHGQDVTYAQYRAMEKEVLAYSAMLQRERQAGKGTEGGAAAHAHAHVRYTVPSMRGSTFNTTVGNQQYQLLSPSARMYIDDSKLQKYLTINEKLLPVACGASVLSTGALTASARTNIPAFAYGPMSGIHSASTACTTSSGAGAMCWMQCVPLSSLSPTCTATEAMCVDTSNNNAIVDGTDHCPGSPMNTACKLMCPGAPSTSPSSSSSSTPSSSFCYGTGTDMIMEGFRSQIVEGYGNTPCINILFPTWTLDSPGKFVAACFGTLLIGIAIGGLTKLRLLIGKKFPLCPWGLKFTLSSLLLATNLTLGYFDMLIAMTYSVELFVMVILGLAFGSMIFHYETIVSSPELDEMPCCHDNAHANGASSVQVIPTAGLRDADITQGLLGPHVGGNTGAAMRSDDPKCMTCDDCHPPVPTDAHLPQNGQGVIWDKSSGPVGVMGFSPLSGGGGGGNVTGSGSGNGVVGVTELPENRRPGECCVPSMPSIKADNRAYQRISDKEASSF